MNCLLQIYLRLKNSQLLAGSPLLYNIDNFLGTEELAHMEIISAIVYQLTRNLTTEEIKNSGFAPYFVDHTTGIYPVAATGVPFTASYFQSCGDPITDLSDDMGAEQKARTTYDNLLRLADTYDVKEPLRFLREREIVHFQRFGESLRIVQENLDSKNFYAFNPAFDRKTKFKKCVG
ncbi:MAG: manganese catalase family protein [Ruminococcus sp.]|nr:manganese catalase family protein [Ruminococcus sp.]